MNESILNAILAYLECGTRTCNDCHNAFGTECCPEDEVTPEDKIKFAELLRENMRGIPIKAISQEEIAELLLGTTNKSD